MRTKTNSVKNIKYFVGYDCPECYAEKRDVSAAAMTKAGYICKKLVSIGYKVDIISNSTSRNRKGFYREHTYKIDESIFLHLTPSFGRKNRLMKVINRAMSNCWLLVYGMRNLEKGETILVYHGLEKIRSVLALKKLKSLTLVLEVEELYKNVGAPARKAIWLEDRIIATADKYIVITEELNRLINSKSKEYCILNGTYEYIGRKKEKQNHIVNLVYAGTFNEEKGGAFLAIDAMAYLPEYYKLYICGFGTDEETEKVKQYICDKNNHNEIVYVGLKRDREFLEFLMECDIGLSTQKGMGAYNDTSFPSKIFTYICCGLKVVSADIPVVRNSSVSECIKFYQKDLAEDIAYGIMDAGGVVDGQELINRLDCEFEEKLRLLMG